VSRTKIITIICWCISAFALVGLCVWFVVQGIGGNGLFNFGQENFNHYETHIFSADGITSLEVDWTSGSIVVSVHDGRDIIVTEYSRRVLRDRERMRYSTSDGTLSLDFQQGRVRMNPRPKPLNVQIPASALDTIDSINITSVSGRVEISDIDIAELIVHTTSGRIELADIVADSIYLRTMSGRIETTRTEATSIRTHTVSGRHTIFGAFGNIDANSTSGRLELSSTVMPDAVVGRTRSGRIELTVPRTETAVSVQYSVTSGRFSSQIPVITHGANPQFELRTTSGRISIYGR